MYLSNPNPFAPWQPLEKEPFDLPASVLPARDAPEYAKANPASKSDKTVFMASFFFARDKRCVFVRLSRHDFRRL